MEECIAEGILADFLRSNRAEVEMTSIFEYNKEEEEKKLRKAEYELGLQQGMESFALLIEKMNANGEAGQLAQLSDADFRRKKLAEYGLLP